ncbi:MAG: hypothetical protein AB7O39_14735 [Flavobacteriaceae bacterium]
MSGPAAAHLKKIRMNLARSPEHPNGSTQHGYEFTAPLDSEGHIDPVAWKRERQHCRVRRFWGLEADDVGHLVHRPGGSWAFVYDIAGDEDDEAGYRFGRHAFNIGEYVSVKDEDGEMHTFQVVTVENV